MSERTEPTEATGPTEPTVEAADFMTSASGTPLLPDARNLGAPTVVVQTPIADAFDPDAAVSIRQLTKHYGPVRALDGLDLDIPRNSVYGIIGPNGAGKTTMMTIAATLLLPTSGHIRVMGIDPVVNPMEVRRRMGYMPDVMGVNERLTVNEYLMFYAHVYQRPKAQRQQITDSLLELVNLHDKKPLLVDSLSRGMKQRLSLARALIHEPELLILDEPASGLDPSARLELRLLILELQRMGKTIIISSHILSELEEMCTHVGIIANGRLASADQTQDIVGTKAGAIKIRIRLADGRQTETQVADIAAQQMLLWDLVVNQRLPVIEFAVSGGGLEEHFQQVVVAAGAPAWPLGQPHQPAALFVNGKS